MLKKLFFPLIAIALGLCALTSSAMETITIESIKTQAQEILNEIEPYANIEDDTVNLVTGIMGNNAGRTLKSFVGKEDSASSIKNSASSIISSIKTLLEQQKNVTKHNEQIKELEQKIRIEFSRLTESFKRFKEYEIESVKRRDEKNKVLSAEKRKTAAYEAATLVLSFLAGLQLKHIIRPTFLEPVALFSPLATVFALYLYGESLHKLQKTMSEADYNSVIGEKARRYRDCALSATLGFFSGVIVRKEIL